MKRRPFTLARLKSPWLIVLVVLGVGLGCVLLLCRMFFQEAWKQPLRGYLPPDAHDVKCGGFTALLTVEGVYAFTSSPAATDKLVTSGGFADITDDIRAPDGQWMRADLDDLARRHVGNSLDSLGTVQVYQWVLRRESDIFEDIVIVRNAGRDRVLLYYRYQQ